jgi:hypothetical protein
MTTRLSSLQKKNLQKKILQRKNNSRHIFLDSPPTQHLFKLLLVIKKNLLPKWNHKTLSKIFNISFFKTQKTVPPCVWEFLIWRRTGTKESKGKTHGGVIVN